MKISDAFKLVFRIMFQKKTRVMLTISGIIIGIFTFTFFIFAAQGLENAISEQFSAFGANVLAVRTIEAAQSNSPEGSGLSDTDITKIKQVIRNYKYIAPAIFYNGQFEYGREKKIIQSLAYPDEYWDELKIDLGNEIESGRDLKQGDKGVIVLGAKTAKIYDEDSPLKIGSSIKIKDKNFRVIGILKEKGDLLIDNILLMPFNDIKELSEQKTYTMIRISFEENADLELMKSNLLRKLNPNGKEKRVNITSPTQVIKQLNQIIGILTLIISFISAIALIVGGINVMNTMYSNVIERINEISVMKAMGGTNWNILSLFLIESSILGFIGAIIGFSLAYGLAELLSYIITNFAGYNVPIFFNLNYFFAIIIITTILSALFGTYPAVKAAQVDPADNLRDE